MHSIMSFAIRYRPWVVVAFVLISLAALFQLPRLYFDLSGEGLIIKGNAEEQFFQQVTDTFGTDQTTVLFLSDPALFTAKKLKIVHSFEQSIDKLPFVAKTASLFSARHMQTVDGFIQTKPYLHKVPDKQSELNAIRDAALENPLIKNNLLSSDATAIAINVVFNEKSETLTDQQITTALEEVIETIRPNLESVFQIGSAYLHTASRANIDIDQRVVLPTSVLVLLTTLGFMLRKFSAAAIPLVTAGMSVLWTLGVMAAMDISVNVMTAIIPALLIIVGSTEDIHLLAEYQSGIRKGLPRISAVRYMSRKMGLAILLTFITTYLGFLSISLNQIDLLKDFGLVASVGLFINFLVTVFLIPVLLSWFGSEEVVEISRNKKSDENLLTYLLDDIKNLNKMTCSNRKRRLSTYLALTVVTGISLYGATSLKVDNNPFAYFNAESEVLHRSETLHQKLSGLQTLSIVVTGTEGDFLKATNLSTLKKNQQLLDDSGNFDKSLSFANFISVMHKGMNDGEADQRSELIPVPITDAMIQDYMSFVQHERVRSLVSPDFSQAQIILRHHIGSSAELTAATEAFLAQAHKSLGSELTIDITGKSWLMTKASDHMVAGQMQSLGLMATIIFVLVSLLFKTFKAGLAAVVANLFPVMLLFGFMGFAGLPLNTATVMVAAIAIGLSVDATMHFMVRYHHKSEKNDNIANSLQDTIKEEFIPIGATAIALLFGFGAMALSLFPPVAEFGMLSALVMVLSLISTFVVLPLLIRTTQLSCFEKKVTTRHSVFRVWDRARLIHNSSLTRSLADFLKERGMSRQDHEQQEQQRFANNSGVPQTTIST